MILSKFRTAFPPVYFKYVVSPYSFYTSVPWICRSTTYGTYALKDMDTAPVNENITVILLYISSYR